MTSLSPRSVATLAVLIALVAGLGHALAAVPNVELMGLSTFVCGALLGPWRGGFVGGGAMALYSLSSPWGIAPPAVFAGQLLGLALFGIAGGLAFRTFSATARARSPRTWLRPAAAGFVLTVIYDLLTNLGVAWTMGTLREPLPVVGAGLAFGAWHLLWNTVLFAVGAPTLLLALRRRRIAVP
jgi:hypothetical protein